MEIKHLKNDCGGEFYIEENDRPIAEMTYSMIEPGVMLISHTGVQPILRGQGIAMKMVVAGVDYARENNLKIVPSCSYVRVAFERHPEWKDLLR